MNHVSVNYEYHVPLHVKPVQSKKGGVTDAKLMIILERHKSVICLFSFLMVGYMYASPQKVEMSDLAD